MAFYDSVKDDIREENGAADRDADPEDDTMPFDQLKKDAEEQGDESSAGSETEIEVLTDDGLQTERTEETATDTAAASAGAAQDAAQDRETSQGTAPQQSAGADDVRAATLDTLQRIEQQNDEMLDVLRGIKRSLD